MNQKSLAIITARGGSKRIPRKNIKDFCGKPIMAYSIEAALEAGCFDTVMVSTDDEEIAQIAKKYGAEVPFLRSERTAGDFATTADVLMEVFEEYEKRGEKFDHVGVHLSNSTVCNSTEVKGRNVHCYRRSRGRC